MFKVIICLGLLIAFVSIVSSDELLSALKPIPTVAKPMINREGGHCGGSEMVEIKTCDKGLTCVYPDPLLMDAPGICINLNRICPKD
jgi:hypothetical protein